MVGLLVSTSDLVTAYRFIASYEILKLVGVASMPTIGYRLMKLPKPTRPGSNKPQAPFVRATRSRQQLILLGMVLMLLTAAMLIAHFRIPPDIGKPAVPPTPPPNLDQFRPMLVTFFLLLIPVICLNVWFWWAIICVSPSKAE